MRVIKRLLFRLLGHKKYLIFISRCFIFLYDLGLLRIFRKFDTHYLAAMMVSEGDSAVDIGANVGYYSTIFARNVGPNGIVTSVEPIPLYREILEINTKKYSNLKILPYALGDYNGRVKMGIPEDDPTRHGLTRVLGRSESDVANGEWDVEIRKTAELFNEEFKVDYLKCDIEGYEDRVMPGLNKLIEKNRPIIQIELSQDNLEPINKQLELLGYRPYLALDRKLVPMKSDSNVSNDIVYLTEELSLKLQKFIAL